MKLVLFCISFVSAKYVGRVFRCGKDFSGDVCPQSLGCSQYGYCGNTDAYTKEGCQSNCYVFPITSKLPVPVSTTVTSKLIPTTTQVTIPTTITVPTTSKLPVPVPTGSIFRDSCNTQGTIALTFDDGPSDLTYNFIMWLSNNNIPATFFVIGNKINSYITTIQQMSRLGFEIGCHTWDHTDLTTLSDDQIRIQISSTNNLIKQVTGKYPKYFRAPYLSYNSRVENIVKEFNMLTISVNLDTFDWKYQATNPSLIYEAYLNTLPFPNNKGYITLQHDRYVPSLDLVPKIVDYIRSQNFKMVTMNECVN